MVRVHVKGGIWKNTEDEILKAAVMKYGLYQWGRIASLMNRKTAKQCKARWYEWLDPSIKKTEWSREEDEKLLHAAKIMPCQWRSIAAIVGRTASQCLDRYRRLLDAATHQDSSEEPLIFGQIEQDPESKPALPDAIDMEEDEKEMLQEARARMANTKGKKAKRIAREKQLEEARRLAVLQRKREMKAAGIDVGTSKRYKKYRGPDLNKEIPFFHVPVSGFHETSEELMRPSSPVDFRTISQIASEPARRYEEEERLRRLDQLKEQNKVYENPLAALEQLQKEQEQRKANLRRQAKLRMPEAQITEEEIKQLAKMTFEPEGDGSGPTADLLCSYTVDGENMPVNDEKPDYLMIEAANQAAVRAMPAPLAGGENPTLAESNFRLGAWKEQLDTPNPLKTPLNASKVMFNRRVGNVSGTPIRDKLGLNTPQMGYYESQQELVAMSRNRKEKLKAELANLPKPKYTEFSVEFNEPTVIEDQEGAKSDHLEDVEDMQLALRIPERLERLKELRSLSFKASLMRPSMVPVEYVDVESMSVMAIDYNEGASGGDGMEIMGEDLKRAERLLRFQIEALVKYDDEVTQNEHVLSNTRDVELVERFESKVEIFGEEELNHAKSLLEKEVERMRMREGDGQLLAALGEQYCKSWDLCHERFRYFAGRVLNVEEMGESERIGVARGEYELLKGAIQDMQRKISILEKRLGVYHGGYLKRCSEKEKAIRELVDKIWAAQLQFVALERRRQWELQSIKKRVAQEKDIWDRVMKRANRLYMDHGNEPVSAI